MRDPSALKMAPFFAPFGGAWRLAEASVSWGASGGFEVVAIYGNSNVCALPGRQKLLVKVNVGFAD